MARTRACLAVIPTRDLLYLGHVTVALSFHLLTSPVVKDKSFAEQFLDYERKDEENEWVVAITGTVDGPRAAHFQNAAHHMCHLLSEGVALASFGDPSLVLLRVMQRLVLQIFYRQLRHRSGR